MESWTRLIFTIFVISFIYGHLFATAIGVSPLKLLQALWSALSGRITIEEVSIFEFLLHHFQVLTLILLLGVGLFSFGVLFDNLSLLNMTAIQIWILINGRIIALTYLNLTFLALITNLSWTHLRKLVHWLILWMWIQLKIFHVLS